VVRNRQLQTLDPSDLTNRASHWAEKLAAYKQTLEH